MISSISFSRKNIGLIIVGISLFLFGISFAYMDAVQKLNAQLHQDCDLPNEICPFKKNIPPEAAAGFAVAAVTAFFGGFVFVTSPKDEREMTEKMTKRNEIVSKLDMDEKKIYSLISESGAIFQSELVEKTGMSKVKITRLLDRLESKGIVERKRRGMTNVVVLKQ